MAFGGPAEVLQLVQAERPMLAVDEDEIEVELSQDVDHPRGWEGKVVAVRLATGSHGGFHSVGLLHRKFLVDVRQRRSDGPGAPALGGFVSRGCAPRPRSSHSISPGDWAARGPGARRDRRHWRESGG